MSKNGPPLTKDSSESSRMEGSRQAIDGSLEASGWTIQQQVPSTETCRV